MIPVTSDAFGGTAVDADGTVTYAWLRWQDRQIILEILDELGVSLVCEPWIPEDGFEGLTLTRQDVVQQSGLMVRDLERLCCVQNTDGVGPEDVAEAIDAVYTGGTDYNDFLQLANYLGVAPQVSLPTSIHCVESF